MSDFISQLERDLVRAADVRFRAEATRTLRVRTRPWRTLLVALALFVGVAGVAAAATLVAVRSTIIAAPSERDAGPAQTQEPGTDRLSAVRAPDPAGAAVAPWGIRVARHKTGQVCGTTGQVVNGRLGIVGLDGRFRVHAPGVVDSCGVARAGQTALVGTRVFDAPQPRDVRTVLNGIGGAGLRSVVVETAGARRPLAIGAGGTFVAAYRGYPEDVGLVVDLRYADGRREHHGFGISRSLFPDPLGAPAWAISAGNVSGYEKRNECVAFYPARDREGPPPVLSPPACGYDPLDTNGPSGNPDDVFFAVRRLSRVTFDPRRDFSGRWRPSVARTAVWGAAGRDVRRITVVGAPGGPRSVRPTPGGHLFLVAFPATVAPRALRVRVQYTDGTRRTFRGDTHLVSPKREPSP